MHRSNHPDFAKRSALVIVLLALLLAACSAKETPTLEPTATAPVEIQATDTPAEPPTAAPTRTPRPTETPASPPTETLNPSPSPTFTPLPTETATPLPELPVGLGTPIPLPAGVIAPQNVSNLKELATGGVPRLWELRLSADGKRLFQATSRGVTISDAAYGQIITTIPQLPDCQINIEGTLHSILPSTAGDRVLICSSGQLWAYGVDGQMLWYRPVPQYADPKPANTTSPELSFSADLAFMAQSGVPGSLRFEVWDNAANQLVFNERGTMPRFSPQGDLLAASFNGNIWLYRTQDWSKWQFVGFKQGWELAFLPDNAQMAIQQTDRLSIYNLTDASLVRTFFTYRGSPHPAVFFSPNSQYIAWPGRPYPDTPLLVWSITDGRQLTSLRRTTSIWDGWPEEFTRLRDDGSAYVDENAEDLIAADEAYPLPPGYVVCLLQDPSAATCAITDPSTYYDLLGRPYTINPSTPGEPYEVYQINLNSASLLGYVAIPPQTQYFPSSLSPDARYLFISTLPDERTPNLASYRSELWHLPSGAMVTRWPGKIANLAFSTDGRYAAILLERYVGQRSSGLDLYVMEFLDQRIVYQEKLPASTGIEPTGMAFLPQGEFVYAYDTSRAGKKATVLKFLDTEAWQPRREVIVADLGVASPQAQITSRLPAIAVSPDGRILAIALTDNRVRFYDLSSSAELTTFTPHISQTTFLAFSPDGRLLGTLSEGEGFTRVWGVWP